MGHALTYPFPVLFLALFARAVDDPDAAEVALARDGDEGAFERLVVRHERGVFLVARRLLGDPDDALDATQETFLRAWRAVRRFRGEATFRSWVTGIALNVCRNQRASAAGRARRASVPLAADDPEGGEAHERPLPDPGPGPEAAAGAAELRRALERALAALPPAQREPLLLFEVQGLSYEELAAALGCRLGTVRSRLARARAALRAGLEGEGGRR